MSSTNTSSTTPYHPPFSLHRYLHPDILNTRYAHPLPLPILRSASCFMQCPEERPEWLCPPGCVRRHPSGCDTQIPAWGRRCQIGRQIWWFYWAFVACGESSYWGTLSWTCLSACVSLIRSRQEHMPPTSIRVRWSVNILHRTFPSGPWAGSESAAV